MTEKNGVNNDGSDCVDSSKLFKTPPLLAPEGSDPTVGGSSSTDLLTEGGRARRLKAAHKARRLTERAQQRLRRTLRKERRLSIYEIYYGENSPRQLQMPHMPDLQRIEEAAIAYARESAADGELRELQAGPIALTSGGDSTSYHQFIN